MEIIAKIFTDFPTKFGVPRQSGLIENLRGKVIFEKPFRNPDAVRGLEGFSHLWLIWQFSQVQQNGWCATVRPPRLGGNRRMGVFATRSPFRPNPIGLSSVRLEEVEIHPQLGPVLHVLGADLIDGTPIFDIKPYLPFTDCHPEATAGFAEPVFGHALDVVFPENLLSLVPPEHRQALLEILRQDPRPSYQQDPQRIYGVPFAGLDVRFQVDGDILSIREVVPFVP